MGFLSSLDISASGLTAQRMRMDTISQNIANAKTTQTANGEPYQRRVVVLAEQGGRSFAAHLRSAKNSFTGHGVKVASVVTDTSDYRIEYDPSHPDADQDGYVRYPNVDEMVEIVDMMAATRAFEANVTAFNAAKSMAVKALEIGK